jgi:hypothetical protein
MGQATLSRRALLVLAALASVAFIPLFVTRGIGAFDFWWWMTLNNVVLLALAVTLDRGFVPALREDVRTRPVAKIGWGLASAALLYGVFFVGNLLSRQVLPQAGGDIEAVYGFRGGASALRIGLLMLFVFGPGEELFWRGVLQRGAAPFVGARLAFVLATALYAGVHIGSLNVMLVVAALVCGAFWGALYEWRRSLLVNVVSHTVWDIAVFLVWPYR